MSLTVNSRVLAEAQPRNVNLRELAGAHELTFFADIKVNPLNKTPVTAELHGAQVTLKAGGYALSIGYVRSEMPLRLKQYDGFVNTQHALFGMNVDARQIATIEDARNGGDLDFELVIKGEGLDTTLQGDGICQINDTWQFHVPRSTWIATLRQAKVVNILLFEVPVPLGAKAPHAKKALEFLDAARTKFLEGDYRGCVAECRTVVQELGAETTNENDWSNGILKRLAAGERGLRKYERHTVILAALRSYAHLAHHGESEGSVADFSRGDATFALGLASVIAGHTTRV